MQPYVTTPALLLLVLLVLSIAGSLGRAMLAVRQWQETPDWHQIRPSGSHWLAALGSAAFHGLTAWVWLFVGSGRADAVFQMRVAYGLSFAFGLAAIWSGIGITRLAQQRLRWRSDTILHDVPGEGEVRLLLADVVGWHQRWSGEYEFLFRDGRVLKLDPYARGSDDLFAALMNTLGVDES